MGEFKWRELGIPYSLEGVKPPTADRVKNAKKTHGYRKLPRLYETCTWIKKKPDGNIGLLSLHKSR